MRFWWVNQNQTFEQETHGGYLWSPKRNANDHRNPFYEFMREVAPGDVVFSFQGTYIRAIGVAGSYCYECPKPAEFGSAGPNWSNIGWKVDVRFTPIERPIRPADYMPLLAPLLPAKYSPLRPNGHGLQSIYLTALPPMLADALLGLMDAPVRELVSNAKLLDQATLLLTPSIDHLFDRGFISFERNGDLLVSPVADREALERMGVPVAVKHNVGSFSEGQKKYLEFHQDRVFLASRVER